MLRRLRSSVALLLTLAMLLTLGPARPAAAAEELSEDEAVTLLQEYGIVLGDPDGNLRLGDPLTRAQAAAIFVRAYGMADLAPLLRDAVPFPDAVGHWGAGEIALAHRMGLMRGDPSGLFRPNDRITYAEVLTVLLRMVEQEPSPWNPDVILDRSRALAIAPAGVGARDYAVRGKIFWSLANTLVNVPLRDAPNLLRKHIDQEPPELYVNPVTTPTADTRVTVTGTAVGAYQVLVNGERASYNPETKEFSHSVSLDLGVNKVTVQAVDRAGNTATDTVTVERRGVVSRITIQGPSILPTNSSQRLEVTATDSRGNALPLDEVEATVSGGLATFNTRTMTITTTDKTGRGTLTLRSGNATGTYTFQVYGPSDKAESLEILEINKGNAPAVGKEVTVTVRVLDANGKVVTDDYFRTITLRTSGMSGLTVEDSTVQTEKGVATFTLKASRTGTATLEVSSPGLQGAERVVEFLESTRITLTVTPKSLKPDGSSKATIRAALVDENGKSITNRSGREILIRLTESGTDGYFENDLISIPPDRSNSSGNDAVFVAGVMPGTATIRGEVISDHKYSVQTLSLPVDQGMTGSRFDITFSPSNPKPGDTVKVTVRVLDSSNRVVTTGSYAFQLKLSTSNNDRLLGGIPEGVTLSFPNSGYYPVDDGLSDSHPDHDPMSVVGRTYKGVAELRLTYGRSGTVRITPVPVKSTYEAYNSESGFGAAASSLGFYAPTKEISFVGTPAKVILTVDSDLGKDQPGGAAYKARNLTVRAKVVDAYNNPIPNYKEYATLERLPSGDGVTRITGANRRLTANGVAEFTVHATGEVGWDQYQVKVGNMTSAPLTIAVNKQAPPAPQVIAIHGVKSGGLSPVGGYVGPDADFMEITLATQDPLNLDQPANYVIAKVYRKGESKPFFTSEAFDLASGVPTIRIPRSALKPGTYYYEVVVNNGAGDSYRSLALDDYTKATVVEYNDSYKLNSATYDAVDGRLTLSVKAASGGTVDPGKIRIVKGNEVVWLDPSEVEVKSVSSSSVVILLHGQAGQITPERFYGANVYVEADAGWFTNKEGTQVARAAAKAPLTPMATITEAALDLDGKRLYLYGEGFRQGSLSLPAIGISDGTETVKLTSKDKTATTPSDTQIVVTLHNDTVAKLKNLTGTTLSVVADAGWVYTGSGSSANRVGAVAGVTVYGRATVTRAEYDRAAGVLRLTGSNLNGATVDTTKLEFRLNTKQEGWRPQNTPVAVTNPKADTLEIQLHPDDAQGLVSRFSGRVVYMNTLEGWLIDAAGRRVLPLPDYSVQFTVPSK
ncbi:MAG: S-layer homology domain-containing protein [Symbiobacterium sp.]|uniref:S-layer homology domain-containing protein n=1 Tax=Symbiobacterium sp. TaxID=1971213 RepID=UPI003464E81B